MRKLSLHLCIIALVVAACSSEDGASTTTVGAPSAIVVEALGNANSQPLEFNGTTCDLDDNFHGTITGVEAGGSGTIEILLHEPSDSAGHIVIAGVAELEVDEGVISVVEDEFALEVMSDSVNVFVVQVEWPACSS
jgi:hypothetical protein